MVVFIMALAVCDASPVINKTDNIVIVEEGIHVSIVNETTGKIVNTATTKRHF